uniref:Pyruvate kinase C-terminal domain-containing protein n=1 Tax=Eutreptiella gymnastica TaxID=73025 RepID=A0A7S4CKD8_9EUGL
MADVAHEAESLAQNEAIWRYMKDSTPRPVTSTEAMASSAVALSFDDEFGMIVVISETGDTERFVAKYRPRIPVLIVTDQPYIYRQAVFRKGLRPMLVDSFGATLADKGASFMGDLKAMRRKSSMGGQQLKVNTVLQSACREGKELSLVKPGDKVIAIYDSDLSDGVEEATTLRVITVE